MALGNAIIKVIPAHFMHSEGNFQFYDPVSKILFSGDMGASIVSHNEATSRWKISMRISSLWKGFTSLHDFQQDMPLLGEHGAPDGCGVDRAAARQIVQGKADDHSVSRLG